jgi:anti-sigma regulatory factor (Ser/Thr protein kinase)
MVSTLTSTDPVPVAPGDACRQRPAADRRIVSFECVRQPAGEPLRPEDARRVGQMRRLGRASLRYWGFKEAVTEQAAVLISELVTNALQHGRGPQIGFTISHSEATVRIEVGDDSSELPTICREPAPDAERGRGLLLVAELSDAWGTSADGKRTWCDLKVCDGADGPPQ